MTPISDARESPAAARNAAPILEVLRAHLPRRGRVLEVAAGAGQHAATFSAALPGLEWSPTDPEPSSLASIAAWRARAGVLNLQAPSHLDAAAPETWPDGPFDAVVCINMIHISPWAATQGLMRGAATALAAPGGLLALYGPYFEADAPTAPSNMAFDADLKRRHPAWGLRDRDAVVAEARAVGLFLTRRVEMPANNLMLLFRRA